MYGYYPPQLIIVELHLNEQWGVVQCEGQAVGAVGESGRGVFEENIRMPEQNTQWTAVPAVQTPTRQPISALFELDI